MQATTADVSAVKPRKSRSTTSGKRVEFEEGTFPTSSDVSLQPDTSRTVDAEAADLVIDTERMGKLYEKLKEPDPWPNEFSKIIKLRQEKAMGNLVQIRESVSSIETTFETEFVPLIRTALGGLANSLDHSSSPSRLINVQYLGAEGQPYCEGLVNVLKQCDVLIFACDQLAGRSSQPSHLQDINASFKKDKELALATIEAGRRVAETDTEKLLADSFEEVRIPHGLTSEEELRGRLLLSRGFDKETSPKQPLGLGKIAGDAGRAIEKLCFAGLSNLRDQDH